MVDYMIKFCKYMTLLYESANNLRSSMY